MREASKPSCPSSRTSQSAARSQSGKCAGTAEIEGISSSENRRSNAAPWLASMVESTSSSLDMGSPARRGRRRPRCRRILAGARRASTQGIAQSRVARFQSHFGTFQWVAGRKISLVFAVNPSPGAGMARRGAQGSLRREGSTAIGFALGSIRQTEILGLRAIGRIALRPKRSSLFTIVLRPGRNRSFELFMLLGGDMNAST